ncbi:MAG: hypothetical protein IJU98_11355 [Synergistaceae bacterium]|nr:hypothetical protein [Synergistaceae bacterium]
MDAVRDVSLTIGKGIYNIKTPLKEDVLERVKSLIDHAYGAPIRGMGQEDLLVLTCLKLAYTLDAVATKLNGALERLDTAAPEER